MGGARKSYVRRRQGMNSREGETISMIVGYFVFHELFSRYKKRHAIQAVSLLYLLEVYSFWKNRHNLFSISRFQDPKSFGKDKKFRKLIAGDLVKKGYIEMDLYAWAAFTQKGLLLCKNFWITYRRWMDKDMVWWDSLQTVFIPEKLEEIRKKEVARVRAKEKKKQDQRYKELQPYHELLLKNLVKPVEVTEAMIERVKITPENT